MKMANAAECNEAVFRHGEALGFFYMTSEQAEAFCQGKTKETGDLYDWHRAAGWACVKVLLKKSRVLDDGQWYWVQYEGLGKTYEAPAIYRADAKAFYSVEFSGIPAHQVLVLKEA